MIDNVLGSANPTRKKKWECVKCKRENSTIRSSCSWCGHEPVLGRRDVNPEGRKYSPPEDEV